MFKKILKKVFYLANNILYRSGYQIKKMDFKSVTLKEKNKGGEIEIYFKEGTYPIQRIVILIDNKEVGILDWQETVGHSAIDLHSIKVDEHYRRRGYGTKLMEVLEKIARERKVTSIFCFTGDDNDNALRIYKNNGYEKVKELSGCFFNRESKKNYQMLVKKL